MFGKCGGSGVGGICDTVPSVGITGNLIMNARIAVMDCKMEHYGGVATVRIALYESGCIRRSSVCVIVPSVGVAGGLNVKSYARLENSKMKGDCGIAPGGIGFDESG